MSEWKEIELGKLADVKGGKRLPKGSMLSKTPNSHPYIRTRDINNNCITVDELLFVPDEVFPSISRYIVKKDDVIISIVGTIGLCAIIPKELHQANLTENCANIVNTNEEVLDRKYLFYYLISEDGQAEIESRNVGSTQPKLPLYNIQRIPISLPPLPEQKAIASVLSSLDDKIELLHRQNKTLEEMARALFKSWFVDFDPVRAKMEGRDTGLPKHLTDLFPNRLVDSELGEIPEGWKVKALGDLLELAYGKALKADIRHDGDVPVYGSNGEVGWHDKRLVQGPGIVVGRKGNPGVVTWATTDFFPIDTTFYVVPKDSNQNLYFLFYALKGQDLPSIAADSAVPGLNRSLAYMNKQVMPVDQIVEHFNGYVGPIFVRSHCLEAEACTLAFLRDVLLPKLISGEIRLRDVDKRVEAVI